MLSSLRFSRRFSVASVESFTFDSTDEEMILYDMFGEDYDEVNKALVFFLLLVFTVIP